MKDKNKLRKLNANWESKKINKLKLYLKKIKKLLINNKSKLKKKIPWKNKKVFWKKWINKLPNIFNNKNTVPDNYQTQHLLSYTIDLAFKHTVMGILQNMLKLLKIF